MSRRKRVSPNQPEPPEDAARPGNDRPAAGPPGDARRTGTVAAVLAVLAFALYANTLGHQYAMDDAVAIVENAHVKEGFAGIPTLLARHYRSGTPLAAASALSYRPLSLVTFAAEWGLAPGNPFLGHLGNVLLASLTAALLFATLSRTLRGFHWAWAAGAALLWTVHPLHTEVVANIKSRDEILALLFGLGALYAWARWLERPAAAWMGIALGSWFLALLSKESAVTLLPVFPLAAWTFFRKGPVESAKLSLPFAVPLAAFLGIRAAVLSGTADLSVVSELDNAIVGASGPPERLATGFMVLWKYFRMLVVPHPLVCDYSYRHLPVVGWGSWQALAGLVLYAGLLVQAATGLRRRSPLAFASAAFLAGLALNSQLFVVIGTLFGERLAYAPSVWFCLGATYVLLRAAGLDPAPGAGSPAGALSLRARGAVAALLLVSGAFGVLTATRNPDWRTNLSLFTVDVAKAPESVRIHSSIAGELLARASKETGLPPGEKEALLASAESHSRTALSIRTNHLSLFNLGNVAFFRGRYAEAAGYFERALREAPASAVTRRNLGQSYLAWGRETGMAGKDLPLAVELLEKGVSFDPSNPNALLDLGTAYGRTGRLEKAIASFERAAELDPGNREAWKNLGIAWRAMGNAARAEECERKARGS